MTSMTIVGMAHSDKCTARFVREIVAGPRAAAISAVDISSAVVNRWSPSFARQSLAASGSNTPGLRTWR